MPITKQAPTEIDVNHFSTQDVYKRQGLHRCATTRAHVTICNGLIADEDALETTFIYGARITVIRITCSKRNCLLCLMRLSFGRRISMGSTITACIEIRRNRIRNPLLLVLLYLMGHSNGGVDVGLSLIHI